MRKYEYEKVWVWGSMSMRKYEYEYGWVWGSMSMSEYEEVCVWAVCRDIDGDRGQGQFHFLYPIGGDQALLGNIYNILHTAQNPASRKETFDSAASLLLTIINMCCDWISRILLRVCVNVWEWPRHLGTNWLLLNIEYIGWWGWRGRGVWLIISEHFVLAWV